MKTPFSKKQLGLTAACALALGVFSAAANAQFLRDVTDQALLVDERGATVMSGYGLCWHSDFGPRPGYYECNTQPVAQIVAPAPAPYVPPVVVAAAAPQPVYEKLTLEANVLFA